MIDIMINLFRPFLDGIRGKTSGYSSGQPLFELGDSVRYMHFVETGVVRLVRYQTDGAALVLQRVGANSLLAEASLYATTYHCAAEAQTETTTWAVSRKDFRIRLAADAQFSEAWGRHLAHEVQEARLHAQIVSLKTVETRLNAWIEWKGPLPEKGEWASVAHGIGVSPESLYRELARRRTTRTCGCPKNSGTLADMPRSPAAELVCRSASQVCS